MKILTKISLLCLLIIVSSCGQEVENQPSNETNQVIETIMARRSIRAYKPEAVDRETMKTILECGINAPNGQNKQSWEVRVIDEPAKIDKLVEAMCSGDDNLDPANVKSIFRGAPTLTIIAKDSGYRFSHIDCGLLIENMVLSAWSLGVGSICLGMPVELLKKEAAQEILQFSEGYEIVLCVGFGYADESPAAKPRDMGKVKFL